MENSRNFQKSLQKLFPGVEGWLQLSGFKRPHIVNYFASKKRSCYQNIFKENETLFGLLQRLKLSDDMYFFSLKSLQFTLKNSLFSR
jgi:hypothetical protein